ncbi:hypothetical protein FNP20_000587 [Enterococcus faecium]|uniref:hypothetical protein n=1 Tax=Enterococcus hirae TaxID=1354 RepID=UPI000F6CBF04|nr:hypothetical protein [Enterococcus hirae]EGP4855130.1 hypothetical protein [Enterococcus faecium]VEE76957.1 Uncharacterised protein [Enterococcus hirae]
MSNNEITQNKIEERSLERVKEVIRQNDKKCYFGLSVPDIEEFKELLKIIEPNPSSNKFPDFICRKGFLEHFAVTSSSEGKKGAIHKIEKSKFESKSRKIRKNLSSKTQKVKNEFLYPEHSYKDLINSFKKNFVNHIKSLEKYDPEEKIGIFLIDYADDGALSMAELSLEGVNGLYAGDLGRQEILDSYRLSRDKELLDWLYKFKDKIQYVIFLTNTNVEIIKIDNIPNVQTLLPYKYAISSNFGTKLTEYWSRI